jgi:hypothetical protein
MLKSGDRICNELRFGIHFFQIPFVLLHQEKDPTGKVSINNTDIGFSMHLPSAYEKRYVFSLANEAISGIVSKQGQKMSGKIING